MSQTFPLRDFSGGFTDYIFNAQNNEAERIDNFHIRPDGSIECRHGSSFYNVLKPRMNTQRINQLHMLGDELLGLSDKGVYNLDGELLGPTGNRAFFNATVNSRFTIAKLGDQEFISETNYSSPIKLYRNENGTTQVRTAGLPAISSPPNGVPSHNDQKTYIYGAVYVYEFYIGTTLYRDVSKPVYFSVNAAPDFSSGSGKQIDIHNIPILSNGATANYDTVNVKIELYRTTSDSGNVYYKCVGLTDNVGNPIHQIENGVTHVIDKTTDQELIEANQVLYVNQGSVDNDPPPRAKYLVESNKAIWYLNIQENGEIRSNRGRQSIQHDGDSCPGDFFFDIDAAISAGGSVNDRLVVFTEDKSYRIDGILSENGAGSLIPENISETVGCISMDSVVKGSSEAIYFASKDGFYMTDGYRVKKLSDRIDETYKVIIEHPENIQATYDRFNKRVYWTARTNSEDSDTIYIYEERKNSFTTMSGKTFWPTAVLFTDDLIRADKYGYIYKHDKDLFTDLELDLLKTPSDWNEVPIIYSWKSVAWDLGAFDYFKYITKMSVSGKPRTNVDFTIRSYNEGETAYKELTPTNFRPEINWGDNITWGDPSLLWNKIIFLNKTRRFPRGGLRAKHRQIEITNAFVNIKSSVTDPNSHMVVNSAAKTASIASPTEYNLGLNNEGYTLTLNGNQYEVLSGSNSTLVLNDPNNTLVDGTYPYSLDGYIKGQRPHIHNVILYYSVLDNDGGTPT